MTESKSVVYYRIGFLDFVQPNLRTITGNLRYVSVAFDGKKRAYPSGFQPTSDSANRPYNLRI